MFVVSHCVVCVKVKQWPLAPNSPKWRITRANVSNASLILANAGECIVCRMYRVRGKWLANVGRMYRVREKWLANVGECIESGQKGWRMSGECIESGQSRAANVGASKIGRFIYKKRYFYV